MKTYSFLYLKKLKMGVLKIKLEILEIEFFFKKKWNFGNGILKIKFGILEIYLKMEFWKIKFKKLEFLKFGISRMEFRKIKF